jgi:hypothetical protein
VINGGLLCRVALGAVIMTAGVAGWQVFFTDPSRRSNYRLEMDANAAIVVITAGDLGTSSQVARDRSTTHTNP